ncbi:MAG TPA: FxsA family protein [Nocardioidaceae bacterium]|nr:FxsA family protein [Nocardioidaceae bacterium]
MSTSMRGSMRRRVPWWVLALLFVVLPVVEIFLLIRIGSAIGAWWTVLLLVADGILGSWLIKREGGRAWAALTAALHSGRMPARELADGALILVGGTLLLTPGFVSDAAGLFCVLPFTRPLARRALTRFLTRKLLAGAGLPTAGAFMPGPPPGERRSPGPPSSVVRGEVVDETDGR